MRRRDDRREDPRYDHRVGQLVGAALMVGYVLAMKPDEEVALLGQRLVDQARWFVDEDPWETPQALPAKTVSSPTS